MADAFCMTCADRLYLQLQEITPRCPGESSPVLSYASAVTTQLQTVPALQNCNVNRWGRGKKLDGKDLPSSFWTLKHFKIWLWCFCWCRSSSLRGGGKNSPRSSAEPLIMSVNYLWNKICLMCKGGRAWHIVYSFLFFSLMLWYWLNHPT